VPSGTYLAWISSGLGAQDAPARYVQDSSPYIGTEGRTIAVSYEELTNMESGARLLNPIRVDENGVDNVGGEPRVDNGPTRRNHLSSVWSSM
jgi:hypothetical protein